MAVTAASLQQKFPKQTITPADAEAYDAALKSYLSARESERKPSAFFQPESTQDVADFLGLVKGTDTQFAIRGGGQQPLDGCANIQDGITVDLSHLTGVQVKDGIVSVAAGENWGNVYKALDVQGLGVTGSRSAKGGIGGLALAGGLSFVSSREGFISDNVVTYQVVLASGETVEASRNQNIDLWRALRGGGNNFGIVTRYDLRTFPQKPIWGASVFYMANEDNYTTQVQALVDEISKADASPDTHLMVSAGFFGQFGPANIGLNQVYYTGQDAESFATSVPPALEPFVSVQPQIEQLKQVGVASLSANAVGQAALAQVQTRTFYANITVKADVATLLAASKIHAAGVESLKALDGAALSFTLQPYPKSLLQKSKEIPNVLGLTDDEPLVSILLLNYWNQAADDAKFLSTLESTMKAIEKDAEDRGTKVPFVYLNYAASFQDPIASYGPEQIDFLHTVASQYDPEGVFQKNVPGGFKLAK